MKRNLVFIGIIFLFVGFLAGAVLFRKAATPAPQEQKNENPVAQEIPSPSVKSDAPAVVKKMPTLPPYHGDPITNIGTDLFISQVPADAKARYEKELADLNALLMQEPNHFNEWMRVGGIKNFFNNFIGARDAWEYANLVAPKNSLAYFNLGGLYGDYLKDPVKAEKNYLKAIGNDPKLPFLYLGLAEFYWVFNPAQKALARPTILRGLEEIPGDAGLLHALDVYQ